MTLKLRVGHIFWVNCQLEGMDRKKLSKRESHKSQKTVKWFLIEWDDLGPKVEDKFRITKNDQELYQTLVMDIEYL